MAAAAADGDAGRCARLSACACPQPLSPPAALHHLRHQDHVKQAQAAPTA